MDFWKVGAISASEPLTEETFLAAAKAIRNQKPHPCSLGKHVVSPKARYRPGWYVCGNCFAPIHVTMPLSEARASDK